jgi:hypothetical protein
MKVNALTRTLVVSALATTAGLVGHSSAHAAPIRTAVADSDPDTTPPRGFPAWCAGHRGSTETGQLMLKKDLDDRDAEGWYAGDAVRHLAQASCAWRNNDRDGDTQKFQAIYHQRRAELMKLASMTDAETDELLAATLDEMKSRQAESDYCQSLKSDRDDDKTSSKDDAELKSRKFLVCHRETQFGTGVYDWPDASELQKLASAGNCMAGIAQSVTHGFDKTGKVRLRMAFGHCNAMLSHVDQAKVDTEIATLPPVVREWAKVHRGVMVAAAGQARDFYTAYAAKNPEWKPVLFDEPDKAYQAFFTAYDANKTLLDKAKFLIENHKHHKVIAKLAGCQDEFWKPLSKLVSSKHPASAEAGADALHDQTTYMLARGLVACSELDKQPEAETAFAKPLAYAPTGTGPEQAIQWALAQYVNAHSEDLGETFDAAAAKEITMLRGDALDTRGGGSLDDITGVIKTVAPATTGWVKVSFKTESWMQDDYDCVETNKIDGIKSDGTLVYRQRCTYKGQSKHSSTEAPVLVDSKFAGALKPGRLAQLGRLRGGSGDAKAVPTIVRASKDPKSKIVGYLGFSW